MQKKNNNKYLVLKYKVYYLYKYKRDEKVFC